MRKGGAVFESDYHYNTDTFCESTWQDFKNWKDVFKC